MSAKSFQGGIHNYFIRLRLLITSHEKVGTSYVVFFSFLMYVDISIFIFIITAYKEKGDVIKQKKPMNQLNNHLFNQQLADMPYPSVKKVSTLLAVILISPSLAETISSEGFTITFSQSLILFGMIFFRSSIFFNCTVLEELLHAQSGSNHPTTSSWDLNLGFDLAIPCVSIHFVFTIP